MLFDSLKEWNIDLCSIMDEPWKQTDSKHQWEKFTQFITLLIGTFQLGSVETVVFAFGRGYVKDCGTTSMNELENL